MVLEGMNKSSMSQSSEINLFMPADHLFYLYLYLRVCMSKFVKIFYQRELIIRFLS